MLYLLVVVVLSVLMFLSGTSVGIVFEATQTILVDHAGITWDLILGGLFILFTVFTPAMIFLAQVGRDRERERANMPNFTLEFLFAVVVTEELLFRVVVVWIVAQLSNNDIISMLVAPTIIWSGLLYFFQYKWKDGLGGILAFVTTWMLFFIPHLFFLVLVIGGGIFGFVIAVVLHYVYNLILIVNSELAEAERSGAY